jgi:hypothetical protein
MNTQGFDVVAELSVPLLNQIFQAAWTSGGPPGSAGTIPHSFDIPAGTMIGTYTIASGQVQVPLSGLALAMAPAINGLNLQVSLDLQLQIANPPVPAASMFTLTSDVEALLPLGNIPGTINVGLVVDGLPASSVTATLTSGDPFTANLGTFFSQYIDLLYARGSIPSAFTKLATNVSLYTIDVYGDIYDNPNDPNKKINATIAMDMLSATISLPIHVMLTNINPVDPTNTPYLPQPMGVVTRVDITAPFNVSATGFTLDLASPIVNVHPLMAAPSPEYDPEGPNYTDATTNYGFIGTVLPIALTTEIQSTATDLATSLGTQTVSHPTITQIQDAIAVAFWQQLLSRGDIPVWTPQTVGPVSITDTAPKALADALAIGIDAGVGANKDALTNFLPAGRNFAVGINAAKVLALVQAQIHLPESQGGFGPDFPHTPHVVHNVDGHDARVTRLDTSLTTAIHLDGDVTVINAILGSIDVDASFTEDIGLEWVPGPTNGQQLKADPGTPSVSEGVLAWIISFIVGFVTFGAIGAIIALVLVAVITSVANSIGSQAVVNGVGAVTGIGAWPGELPGIGTVTATFEDPVDISPDGILISG